MLFFITIIEFNIIYTTPSGLCIFRMRMEEKKYKKKLVWAAYLLYQLKIGDLKKKSFLLDLQRR